MQPPKSNNTKSSEKFLVKTLTDEFFQPMRLYYIVYDKAQLEKCFKKLKCMKYDENLDDWIIMYTDEAGKIGLQVSPKKVPKKAQPLVIASIYTESENTMLVDVRSIERAAKIIELIDKYVPKKVAEITHTAIYNKLITVNGNNQESVNDIDYDEIFSQMNITVIDPEKTIKESEKIAAQYKDKEERIQAIIQKTQDDAKKPLPEVEKFPIYFYEEGITAFATACRMRQMIAMKHYQGYQNYSFYDLTQEFVSENIDKLQTEGGWVRK